VILQRLRLHRKGYIALHIFEFYKRCRSKWTISSMSAQSVDRVYLLTYILTRYWQDINKILISIMNYFLCARFVDARWKIQQPEILCSTAILSNGELRIHCFGKSGLRLKRSRIYMCRLAVSINICLTYSTSCLRKYSLIHWCTFLLIRS
jgi:hypothetical protein